MPASLVSFGLSAASGCTGDWCRVASLDWPSVQLDETPLTLKACQTHCSLTSKCIFLTHDGSDMGPCTLYGAGSKAQPHSNAYISVQTRTPPHVPKSLDNPHSYTPTKLKDGGVSLAACKAAFVQAFEANEVDAPFGRFVLNDDQGHKVNTTFSIASPLAGKGPVQIKAKYNGNPNTTNLTGGVGTPQPGGCNGWYLVHGEGGTAKLVDEKDVEDNYLWEFGGDGIRSAASEPLKDGQVCLSTGYESPAGHTSFQVATSNMNSPESPCGSTDQAPMGSQKWTVTFKGVKWNTPRPKRFGMGLCDETGAVEFVKLRGAEQCDDSKCGTWTWELAIPEQGSAADGEGTCLGFKNPPPPPPTPTPPPSPTPSTCDFCHDAHLECCGDGGIHTFCYDPKYNTCCDSPFPSGIDDPVKIVCAKDQQCRHGCGPYSTSTYFEPENQEADDEFEVGTPDLKNPVASLEGHDDPHMCRGKFGVFAECLGGTTCCGANTLTPACYEEEYNECCHPDGSDYSVICAKGQGCASTPNGVPFCVDAYEACRACAAQYPPGFNTYLCHPYGSGACYHAPEPVSCRDVWGESATFCFGMLGDVKVTENETSVEFI